MVRAENVSAVQNSVCYSFLPNWHLMVACAYVRPPCVSNIQNSALVGNSEQHFVCALSLMTPRSGWWYNLGLVRTVHIHRTWPYIRWFPCQNYRIHSVCIWFWPTRILLYYLLQSIRLQLKMVSTYNVVCSHFPGRLHSIKRKKSHHTPNLISNKHGASLPCMEIALPDSALDPQCRLHSREVPFGQRCSFGSMVWCC